MPWYSRRMLLGGAASVCLVIVSGALVWKTVRMNPELAQTSSPAYQEPAPETPVPVPGSVNVPTTIDDTRAPESQAAEARSRREAEKVAPQSAERRNDLLAKEKQGRVQIAPAAPATQVPEKDAETEEVTVTGVRRTLQASMDLKREAIGVVDAISAEDMGSRPAPGGPAGKSVASSRTRGFRGEVVMANVAPPPAPLPQEGYAGRDKFEHFDVNPVKRVADEPVSTFSVDVDTASYSFVRRQLQSGLLPQNDAVRVEEMINYFDYSWPAAETRREPFKPTVVVSDSPWNKGRKLVHIGIKGYEIPRGEQPDANLVLLIDVGLDERARSNCRWPEARCSCW